MATNQINSEDLITSVFNAIPSPILVVDDDMRIHEYNTAATALFSGDKSTVLRRRGGEVLYCLHSRETPEGCGHSPFCKNCVIRQSVMAAFHGNKVVRNRYKMELVRDEKIQEMFALITTSQFQFQGLELVLLVIEDITELMELKRLIPICAKCKKIRNDQDYWVMVESYFKEHLDVDFSHGLCPDCYKKEMEEVEKLTNAKQSG